MPRLSISQDGVVPIQPQVQRRKHSFINPRLLYCTVQVGRTSAFRSCCYASWWLTASFSLPVYSNGMRLLPLHPCVAPVCLAEVGLQNCVCSYKLCRATAVTVALCRRGRKLFADARGPVICLSASLACCSLTLSTQHHSAAAVVALVSVSATAAARAQSFLCRRCRFADTR